MSSLGSETQILYFRSKYSKLALKNYTEGLPSGFPHSVRTSSPNHENKAKRRLLTFVSMSFICPIYNGMFLSQSAPKVLLDPNKDIRFIMEFYKLYKSGRKTTRSSLQSKTQTLYFWTNYSKLAQKSYAGVLQHGFLCYV